ncbi:hypothetical protein J2Y65_002537 [Aeromonas salmonicida]|nr:hypothetical protein [Aeromonas salmonicida]
MAEKPTHTLPELKPAAPNIAWLGIKKCRAED